MMASYTVINCVYNRFRQIDCSSSGETNLLWKKSWNRIELLIQCSNLADLDTFTKTDPICVVFVKTMGKWVEYDRTEAMKNTLNPKFVKRFEIEFDPRKFHHMKFSVYDIDTRSDELAQQDFVGSTEITFTDLIDYNDTIFTCNKTLRVQATSRPRGTISITSEIIQASKNRVNIHFTGQKLEKKGIFNLSKPDVYLEISRELKKDSGVYHPVYRTESYPKSINPRWRPFSLSVQQLCNNDWDRNMQLSCWYISNTHHYHMIGWCHTTMNDLQALNKQLEDTEGPVILDIVSAKQEANKKDNVKGHLRLIQFRVDMAYTLVDYVKGGLHINLMLAIDFTASNGKQDEEHCLHSLGSESKNQYIDAIRSLGNMITECNMDKKVAAYGFGAKWKTKQHASHCFPLTGHRSNPYLDSIPDVIEAYKALVPVLKFSGPTKLSPILDKAIALAEKENTSQSKQIYTLLLVVTDGCVNDIGKVIKRLVNSCHQPLSVLFVGVGPADFTQMEHFNYEMELLRDESSSKTSSRSTTHFIPYTRETVESDANLVLKRDAMAAISKQILEYMKINRIEPNNPKQLRLLETILSTQWNDVLQTPDRTLSGLTTGRRSTSKSRNSVKSLISLGPSCPTCGATIDFGTPLGHASTMSLTATL